MSVLCRWAGSTLSWVTVSQPAAALTPPSPLLCLQMTKLVKRHMGHYQSGASNDKYRWEKRGWRVSATAVQSRKARGCERKMWSGDETVRQIPPQSDICIFSRYSCPEWLTWLSPQDSNWSSSGIPVCGRAQTFDLMCARRWCYPLCQLGTGLIYWTRLVKFYLAPHSPPYTHLTWILLFRCMTACSLAKLCANVSSPRVKS